MIAGTVLAIDVDGTICERGAPPSDRVADALMRANSRGWSVCLCTGRQYVGIAAMAAHLELTVPQVVSEGALVVSPSDGAELHREWLSTDLIDMVVRKARKYSTTAVLGGGGRTAVETWNADIEYMLSYGDPEPDVVDTLNGFDRFEPTIVLLIDRHDSRKLAALESALSHIGELSVRRSAPGYLSVVPAGVSKASGLRHAMHIHGFEFDTSVVVAMGDGANDVPLFRDAHLAVAMENAPSDVRNLATVVAPSVAEDGVAWAIDQLLAGKLGALEGGYREERL